MFSTVPFKRNFMIQLQPTAIGAGLTELSTEGTTM